MLDTVIIIIVAATVFHWLERRAPILPGYRTGPHRGGFVADVTHAVVNGPVLSAITKMTAYSLLVFVPAYGNLLTHWNWGLQFLVFFVANDFARYWLHRWFHESDLLWRIHRVHHATVQMDCLSVIRIHVLESVFKNFLLFVPFQMCGINPEVIVVYNCLDIIKGFWHHANLRTYIGPLNYFLNSAELHWWHHSSELPGQRSNYGSILSVWDWLFGTAYWPVGKWPEKIGVQGLENSGYTFLEDLVSIRFDDDALKKRQAQSRIAASCDHRLDSRHDLDEFAVAHSDERKSVVQELSP